MDARVGTPLTPSYSRDPSTAAAANPSPGGGGLGAMGGMGGFGATVGGAMGGIAGFGAPPDAMAIMGGMSFASLMGGMGAPPAAMGGMSFDVPPRTHSHEDAVEDIANTVGASCDAVRDEEREEDSSSEAEESSSEDEDEDEDEECCVFHLCIELDLHFELGWMNLWA
nr:co-chaperone protein p23-1-like [Aegilops tauschii subsp. strangulata]